VLIAAFGTSGALVAAGTAALAYAAPLLRPADGKLRPVPPRERAVADVSA
jgi:hypothetical protein